MANQEGPGIVRPRRFEDIEGGPPTDGGLPPVPLEPAPAPPAEVIPVPPAPPESPGEPVVIGPPAAPEEPPAYVPPVPDWWMQLPIETRAELEALLDGLRSDVDRQSGRIDSIPRGEDGTDGTNGRDGTNGTNGRDGSLFTSTPEFAALSGRIDTNAGGVATLTRRTDALQTNINTAIDLAQRAQRDATRAALLVEAVASSPPLVPVGPTAAELASAVSDYLRANPLPTPTGGTNGRDGLPGANATDAQVAAAVASYIQRFPPASGGTGVPVVGPIGPPGPSGPPGPGVDPESITQILLSALEPVLPFIDDPADFVWRLILGANRERLSPLFLLLLEAA